jgi:hypothetical protein
MRSVGERARWGSRRGIQDVWIEASGVACLMVGCVVGRRL